MHMTEENADSTESMINKFPCEVCDKQVEDKSKMNQIVYVCQRVMESSDEAVVYWM